MCIECVKQEYPDRVCVNAHCSCSCLISGSFFKKDKEKRETLCNDISSLQVTAFINYNVYDTCSSLKPTF